MTDLTAIQEDVRFDWTAAEDLSSDLRSTAGLLEGQLGERETARVSARALWQGRYGDEFDDRCRVCAEDGSRFASAMRNAADGLDELSRLAREEQDRRERAREWIADQQDDGGGFGIPGVDQVVDFAGDTVDAVDDFLTGEDDVPPDLQPHDPPTIPIEDPGTVTRNGGSAAGPTTYGTGGVSSASPGDLDTWASTSRAMDETLSSSRSSLEEAHSTFRAGSSWGEFDASSMLGALGTWTSLNETDAVWVSTVAGAFREAGGGNVPDVAIQAALDRAGVASTGRVSVTFDDPIVWGEPATAGYADDPVNTAAGNFVETELDLDFGGSCGLLTWRRTYNSRSDRVGPFGRGWSSWATCRLTWRPDGAHWVGPDGQEASIPRVGGGAGRDGAGDGAGGPVGPGGPSDGDTWELFLEEERQARGEAGYDYAGLDADEAERIAWGGPAGPSDGATAETLVHGPNGDGGVRFARVAGVPGLVQVDPDGDGLMLVGLGDASRVVFDADGRPMVASNGPGTEVSFDHDGRGRLARMVHEGGRSLTVEWDDAIDRITAVVCSDGRRITYGYDDEACLVRADGGRQGRRSYEVDELGRVVAVTDADGVVEARNSYDERGRVTGQMSRFGRRTRYRYVRGRVTVVDDDADGPVNSYVHDDHGRLLGVVDGHGHELRKRYDRWGNPVEVTERDGTVTRLEWDERGLLTRRVAPDGSWFRFAHDELGRTVEVTASNGAVTRMAYSGSERNPVEIVDPEGGVTRLESWGGLVHRMVDPDGVDLRLGYDADGELVSTTDTAGNTARIERDAAGRVTATVSPSGLRSEIVYDHTGRPVEQRQPGGSTTRFEWSAAGRLVAVVDPTGGRREVRYGPGGAAEEVVDELGHVTTRRFDVLGNLVGVVLPDGSKWELGYDRLCRLTSTTDPAGATWLREYDEAGHLVGTVDPVGGHRTMQLDDQGRIVAVDDATTSVEFELDELGRGKVHRRPDGSQLSATYDLCGRITAVTGPDGDVTRYGYTPAGRLASVTTPLGHTTRFEYDTCGRRVGVIDPLGARWGYRFDADARLTQVVGPTGETTRLRYDSETGRLASRVSSIGGVTRYVYDVVGRVTSVTDPAGGVTRLRWDARGQLVEAIDPNGGVTRYERDVRGFRRAVVDPLGGRVEHRYDAVGRPLERRDQLGRATQWSYDPAGRLVARTLPTGEQVRWTYDASGRVQSIGTPNDPSRVRISRDLLGRPVAVEETSPSLNENGPYEAGDLQRKPARAVRFRHELEWDAYGRLTAKRRNGLGLAWRYDEDGRRTAVVYPDGTETVFTHDEADRPTSATHPQLGTVSFEHDDAGRLVRRSSDGGSQRWHYRDGVLSRYEAHHDGQRLITDLRRDAGGRVRQATTNGETTNYRYDPAGQLAHVDAPHGRWDFSYDQAGRLTTESNPGGEVTYTYDSAHQLLQRLATGPSGGLGGIQPAGPADRGDASVGPVVPAVGQAPDAADVRYDYDPAGRRTSESGPDGTRQFGWDWLGRLGSIGDTTLGVDSFGDLADVDGVPLLWDPTGAVPQLRWIDGSSIVGDHQPWAVVDRDGGPTWLQHDWQGSITNPVPLVADAPSPDAGWAADAASSAAASGNSALGEAQTGFDPWGVPLRSDNADPGSLALAFGYRGELTVDGLPWLRNRAYDPTGRGFLSTDPLPGIPGQPFAANGYHYGGNDPVGSIDPLGLRPLTEAQFNQYREAVQSNGLFDHIDRAWDATTQWVGDHWEGIAGGLMIAGGIAIMLTGVGGPIGAAMIGGALLSGGMSAGIQELTTGQVNWGQVAVSAAIGGAAGGAGAWAGGWASGATSGWSNATLATAGRYGAQMGVDATVNVGTGMAERWATGQNPFDMQAIGVDTVSGLGTGALGARLQGPSTPPPPEFVYRGGSATPSNLTPRPDVDATGLSTYDNPQAAAPRGGKVQVIETARLKNVVASPDAPPPGHVSLAPSDLSEVPDWAATRGTDTVHPYTQEIMDAVVDEIRLPRPPQ